MRSSIATVSTLSPAKALSPLPKVDTTDSCQAEGSPVLVGSEGGKQRISPSIAAN
jgi:hypothetical protein